MMLSSKALFLGCLVTCAAVSTQTRAATAANPIRKVVVMLQKMQAEVTADGEREEGLYKKFMCYCRTGASTLGESIAAAKNKIESVENLMKGGAAEKEQLEANLKEHQTSRSDAKKAMADANALREKEAAAFKKESTDLNANLAALTKAIAAIENGMSGSFLQTDAANRVRKFAMEKANIDDETRRELLAFLSGTQEQGYVPQSGEITGILKTIKDEMAASLKAITEEETAAIATHEGLIAAKRKEVATLTAQIETELTRIAELAVRLASADNDLADAQESFAADTKFAAELESGCEKKTGEWAAIKKTRAEELVALAETIKVLNDDDALELFKKVLPGASASFLQMQVTTGNMKARALTSIQAAVQRNRGGLLSARPQLDLIEMALKGKTMGFEKVIKMIDDMVVLLKKEQGDDDSKQEFCETKFDETDDKKKGLEQSISDSEGAIDNMNGIIATLTDEIAALEDDIKALDKAVAEATELRKSEHADHETLMTDDGNAKEVLLWAKNRLNKFYNPKLYKAAPKRELTAEESITVSEGGTLAPTPAPGGIANTGIGALAQVAPPPPPETFGAYTKKGESSTGVIAMIDLLVGDLDKEMQESDVMEADSQKEYEEMMSDSAAKRADDSKSLTDKVSAKAAQEEALQAETDKKASTSSELMTTLEFIGSLHGECDWLLKYHATRKAARTEEIEALGNAKAVLSGADYSLVQVKHEAKVRSSNFLGF